jgi:hypothetical protein
LKSESYKCEQNQDLKSEISEFERNQESESESSNFETNLTRSKSESSEGARAVAAGAGAVGAVRNSPGGVQSGYSQRIENLNENINSAPVRSMQDIRRTDKSSILARELIVGQGPSSWGPIRVKPHVLERVRARDAARRALAANGSRSP